jgi:hypothetical protein
LLGHRADDCSIDRLTKNRSTLCLRRSGMPIMPEHHQSAGLGSGNGIQLMCLDTQIGSIEICWEDSKQPADQSSTGAVILYGINSFAGLMISRMSLQPLPPAWNPVLTRLPEPEYANDPRNPKAKNNAH